MQSCFAFGVRMETMSGIHSKSIADRIDWLFELAHRHEKNFRSPEAWLARERYLCEHPTAGLLDSIENGSIHYR